MVMAFIIMDNYSPTKKMLESIYLRAFFCEKTIVSFNRPLSVPFQSAQQVVYLFQDGLMVF